MSTPTKHLAELMESLPPEMQQEVLDYAQYLVDTKVHQVRFYICPVCFKASETRIECHDHLMIPCNADSPEDCKPIIGEDGTLKTRAPRWFVRRAAVVHDHVAHDHD